MLGISFDTEAENKAFAEKFDFGFPLLCDTDRKIGLAYGAAESPTAEYPRRISYLIDPGGRIEATYPKVNPAEHPEEVLQDLTRIEAR